MGVQERRDREKAELRQKIVDAARELFVEYGYEAVSMRKIADAIEYSPTAIYLHFADKEALLREICNADFGALAESFLKIGRIDDPVERIRQIGKAYCKFGIHHPSHYRMMFMTTYACPPSEEDLKKRDDPAVDGYAFLRNSCQDAIDQQRILEELCNADLLAQTVWAGVHGVVSLHVVMKDDPWINWCSIEKRISAMVDVVLRGCFRGVV